MKPSSSTSRVKPARLANRLHSGSFLGISFAIALLAACSQPPKEYTVGGAEYLETSRAKEDVLYEILAYPLLRYEMDLFLESLDAVQAAAEKRRDSWLAIQTAPDPMQAMLRHKAWKEAGVECADFMAAYVKANFIREYLLDPISLSETKANLRQADARAQQNPADWQLRSAAEHLRVLASVVEVQETSGAFDLYRVEKAAIDSALDRFEAIGIN